MLPEGKPINIYGSFKKSCEESLAHRLESAVGKKQLELYNIFLQTKKPTVEEVEVIIPAQEGQDCALGAVQIFQQKGWNVKKQAYLSDTSELKVVVELSIL